MKTILESTHRLVDLTEGLSTLRVLHGAPERAVQNLVSDSRRVMPGDLFVVVTGHTGDGGYYIPDAIDKGASVIVSEKAPVKIPRIVTYIHVREARQALSRLARNYFNTNTGTGDDIRVVGITGTNGKTTTAYLIQNILRAHYGACGMIGTVKVDVGREEHPARITTPGPIELHDYLAQMKAGGVRYCVLEVSSHALVQRRVEDVPLACAVFTNLSQDHLDYHHDLEAYAQAKGRLFELLGPKGCAIVNGEDSRSGSYAKLCPAPPVEYGFNRSAQIRGVGLRMNAGGIQFRLVSPEGTAEIRLPLLGRYNGSNALAAVAAAFQMGVPLDAIARSLQTVAPIPGRLERTPGPKEFAVLVDYAHTPDALDNVLYGLLYGPEFCAPGTRVGAHFLQVRGDGFAGQELSTALFGETRESPLHDPVFQ